MFFNRKKFIEIFREKVDFFENNNFSSTDHIAFLGLRRTGKTSLINHLLSNYSKNNISVYFDFSTITTSVKDFGISIIVGIFSRIYQKEYNFFDEIKFDIKEKEIYNFYVNFGKILETGDIKVIFTKIFEFITVISKYYKLIIAFDEFQDILEFRNFPQLKKIDDIFRCELQKQKNVFYIISGSYPEILKDLLLNPKNKIYSHFEVLEILNFDKQTSFEYAKYLNSSLNHKSLSNIYKISSGNPYLISVIAKRVGNNDSLEDLIKKYIFNSKGQIYNHYLYLLEDSINKIGETSTLKGILKYIAINGDLTKTELSKKLGVSVQLIDKEVKKLQQISILFIDLDKKVKFRDYLFKYFCYYNYSGIEFYEINSAKFYEQKILELQEKLNKTLTELGRTKEFELYYEIKENQGKIWKQIKLPKFKIIQKNYFTQFGDEIDLYAETPAGKKWIFELKYKNKKIGNTEIKKFLEKMSSDKYVFISKSGFAENISEEYKNNKKLFLVSLEK